MATGVQGGLDVLVSGYASIDTVYQASAPPRAGTTALLQGPVAPSPRCGGCGPGAAVALASVGRRVGLITWLGDDPEGRACLQGWIDTGIEDTGVVIAEGQASPRSLLFYDPDGGATCYYHPSGSAGLRLTSQARALLSRATALAITVGPVPLTEALLAARRPDQPLAWNVKADPDAFPAALRAQLAREADVICLNRDELGFVASGLSRPVLTPQPPSPGSTGKGRRAPLPSPWAGYPLGGGWGEGRPRQGPLLQDETAAALISAIQRHNGGIVVVTAGAAGCHVAWPGGVADIPATPVQVTDPTGAGDAFFGAFVAGWLRGADPVDAATAATAHVATFLRERAAGETEA
jgi:sugar/nucleoside kinase (ribokinase family)